MGDGIVACFLHFEQAFQITVSNDKGVLVDIRRASWQVEIVKDVSRCYKEPLRCYNSGGFYMDRQPIACDI